LAHFARIKNGIVDGITTGRDDDENREEELGHDEWIYRRTSYNTRGGVYYDPNTGQPAEDQSKSFRKNYAGIGYSYSSIRDAFIPPKPFNSWILNETTCLWESPTPVPSDVGTGEPPKRYTWDEATTSWVDVTSSE